MTYYDTAVVGLGALGSAAAFHLARTGSVVAFEQFALGHARGASHDTSRILRRSYPDQRYVRLADAAYRDWRELEAVAGERFVTVTGGLTFCPSPAGIDAYAASMSACDVEFDVLDPRSLGTRWPQFAVPAGVLAIAQADSAIVPAGRATAVLQVLGRVRGAVMHAECPVDALTPDGDGVLLHTAAGTVRAGTVVVCADAWTNKLLAPLGAALPLQTTLEQVSYFSPAEPSGYAADRMPVWVWDDEPCYYGFPAYGEPTVKAARDCSGIPVDPDRRSFAPVPERLEELTRFLAGLLPGAGRHARTVTCQYTLTPDRDFALGPVPGFPRILVGLGAGHAFKFAPTIGRVLCELATTGTTAEDISGFALDRPGMLAVPAGRPA